MLDILRLFIFVFFRFFFVYMPLSISSQKDDLWWVHLCKKGFKIFLDWKLIIFVHKSVKKKVLFSYNLALWIFFIRPIGLLIKNIFIILYSFVRIIIPKKYVVYFDRVVVLMIKGLIIILYRLVWLIKQLIYLNLVVLPSVLIICFIEVNWFIILKLNDFLVNFEQYWNFFYEFKKQLLVFRKSNITGYVIEQLLKESKKSQWFSVKRFRKRVKVENIYIRNLEKKEKKEIIIERKGEKRIKNLLNFPIFLLVRERRKKDYVFGGKFLRGYKLQKRDIIKKKSFIEIIKILFKYKAKFWNLFEIGKWDLIFFRVSKIDNFNFYWIENIIKKEYMKSERIFSKYIENSLDFGIFLYKMGKWNEVERQMERSFNVGYKTDRKGNDISSIMYNIMRKEKEKQVFTKIGEFFTNAWILSKWKKKDNFSNDILKIKKKTDEVIRIKEERRVKRNKKINEEWSFFLEKQDKWRNRLWLINIIKFLKFPKKDIWRKAIPPYERIRWGSNRWFLKGLNINGYDYDYIVKKYDYWGRKFTGKGWGRNNVHALKKQSPVELPENYEGVKEIFRGVDFESKVSGDKREIIKALEARLRKKFVNQHYFLYKKRSGYNNIMYYFYWNRQKYLAKYVIAVRERRLGGSEGSDFDWFFCNGKYPIFLMKLMNSMDVYMNVLIRNWGMPYMSRFLLDTKTDIDKYKGKERYKVLGLQQEIKNEKVVELLYDIKEEKILKRYFLYLWKKVVFILKGEMPKDYKLSESEWVFKKWVINKKKGMGKGYKIFKVILVDLYNSYFDNDSYEGRSYFNRKKHFTWRNKIDGSFLELVDLLEKLIIDNLLKGGFQSFFFIIFLFVKRGIIILCKVFLRILIRVVV